MQCFFLHHRRVFFCWFFAVLGCVQAAAATDTSLLDAKRNHGYLASYWHNGVKLAASPTRWKADEWIAFGSTITLTGLIISMDEPISQPLFDWRNTTGKKFGDVGNVAGGLPAQFGLSALALGIGAASKNKPLTHFAIDNLQAQIYAGGVTFFVKELFQRARPNAGAGAYAWNGPFNGSGNTSFFSGHTSLAFSTATMVYLHSKRRWWVGLLSYGAATAIGLSRMQQQKHWASDVIMGAVVGSAVSAFVYRQQQRRRASNTGISHRQATFANAGKTGLNPHSSLHKPDLPAKQLYICH